MVGVIAYQGDFQKHLDMLYTLRVPSTAVKTPEDLHRLSALIIPGGESTTISMLMERAGMFQAIRNYKNLRILGTCAGAILLARSIENSPVPSLGYIGMSIKRNAYGRQIHSFETTVTIPAIQETAYHAIFIRAPIITHVQKTVKIHAYYENNPVFVQEGNHMAVTFHPELTPDDRIHHLFLQNIA